MAKFLVGLGGSLLLGVAVATSVQAQSIATPAEFPPTSYAGTQYVDSTGCAFVRAGNGPLVNWVPRVSRSREHLCGFVPTRVSAAVASAPAGPLIIFEDPPEPEAAPLPEPLNMTFEQVCEGKFGEIAGFHTADGDPVDCGPDPTAAAVAEAAPLEILDVEPSPTPPPVAGLVAARPAAPIPAPLPVADAPAQAPGEAPFAGQSRVTLAQACDGKFGVLVGFILANGDPVDCGPAPVTAATAPVPAIEIGVPDAPIVPVVAPVAAPDLAPEPRRVSLTKICAEIAATGKRVIDAATGEPVACPTAPVIAAVAPAQNGAPAAPGQPMAASVPAAPTLEAPVVATAAVPVPESAAQAPRSTRSTATLNAAVSTFKLPFKSPPVPASNPDPASVANQAIRIPAGFERVWTDGRLNPHRGIPKVF